jgi:hypothetical protein
MNAMQHKKEKRRSWSVNIQSPKTAISSAHTILHAKHRDPLKTNECLYRVSEFFAPGTPEINKPSVFRHVS